MLTLADTYKALDEMLENGPVYMDPYVSKKDMMIQEEQLDKPVDVLIEEKDATYTLKISFNGKDIIGMEGALAEEFRKSLS